MPISETSSFETNVELGLLTQDEDEAYLKRLSVHATVRPSDLKYLLLDRRPNAFGSLQELERKEDSLIVVDSKESDEDVSTKAQELIVKGFEVDSRIVPGYSYTVRYSGTEDYLFGGEARRLESVRLGYGRRMTFKGDRLNNNDCYFWSDSAPNGFVFNIEAVKVDDVFTVYDAESCAVGEAVVGSTEQPQTELDTVISNGTVVKRVLVRFAVAVKYFHHSSHLINVVASEDLEVVEGIAVVEKAKGSRVAYLKCVMDITLQRIGQCSFHKDP